MHGTYIAGNRLNTSLPYVLNDDTKVTFGSPVTRATGATQGSYSLPTRSGCCCRPFDESISDLNGGPETFPARTYKINRLFSRWTYVGPRKLLRGTPDLTATCSPPLLRPPTSTQSFSVPEITSDEASSDCSGDSDVDGGRKISVVSGEDSSPVPSPPYSPASPTSPADPSGTRDGDSVAENVLRESPDPSPEQHKFGETVDHHFANCAAEITTLDGLDCAYLTFNDVAAASTVAQDGESFSGFSEADENPIDTNFEAFNEADGFSDPEEPDPAPLVPDPLRRPSSPLPASSDDSGSVSSVSRALKLLGSDAPPLMNAANLLDAPRPCRPGRARHLPDSRGDASPEGPDGAGLRDSSPADWTRRSKGNRQAIADETVDRRGWGASPGDDGKARKHPALSLSHLLVRGGGKGQPAVEPARTRSRTGAPLGPAEKGSRHTHSRAISAGRDLLGLRGRSTTMAQTPRTTTGRDAFGSRPTTEGTQQGPETTTSVSHSSEKPSLYGESDEDLTGGVRTCGGATDKVTAIDRSADSTFGRDSGEGSEVTSTSVVPVDDGQVTSVAASNNVQASEALAPWYDKGDASAADVDEHTSCQTDLVTDATQDDIRARPTKLDTPSLSEILDPSGRCRSQSHAHSAGLDRAHFLERERRRTSWAKAMDLIRRTSQSSGIQLQAHHTGCLASEGSRTQSPPLSLPSSPAERETPRTPTLVASPKPFRSAAARGGSADKPTPGSENLPAKPTAEAEPAEIVDDKSGGDAASTAPPLAGQMSEGPEVAMPSRRPSKHEIHDRSKAGLAPREHDASDRAGPEQTSSPSSCVQTKEQPSLRSSGVKRKRADETTSGEDQETTCQIGSVLSEVEDGRESSFPDAQVLDPIPVSQASSLASLPSIDMSTAAKSARAEPCVARPAKRQKMTRSTTVHISLLKSAARVLTGAAVAGVGMFAYLAASNPDPI